MRVLEAGQSGDLAQDAGIAAAGLPAHQDFLDGVHAPIEPVNRAHHQAEATPPQMLQLLHCSRQSFSSCTAYYSVVLYCILQCCIELYCISECCRVLNLTVLYLVNAFCGVQDLQGTPLPQCRLVHKALCCIVLYCGSFFCGNLGATAHAASWKTLRGKAGDKHRRGLVEKACRARQGIRTCATLWKKLWDKAGDKYMRCLLDKAVGQGRG